MKGPNVLNSFYEEFPYDCDMLLKVTGTDPVYFVVNNHLENEHLLQVTPDEDGFVKITFPPRVGTCKYKGK